MGTSTSATLPATTTKPATTTTPAPSTSSTSMCEVDRTMRSCVAQGGSFDCTRCTNDSTGEPCCSCDGIEDPVTTTEAATTTTKSPAAKICKSWCAGNPKSWDKKCTWMQCSGCSQCSEDPVTTTEAATTTTKSPAAKICKSWCAGNPKSWDKKCTWMRCSGCSQCS